MTSPVVSTWVEIPADCPISGEIDTDNDGLHVTIGSTAAATDLALDVVFVIRVTNRFAGRWNARR